MPAPHPPALRQRVVDAYENGEGTYAEIAERFKVGEASVSRWLSLVRYGADLVPKPTGGDRTPPIPAEVHDHILSLVRDEPSWTTTELSEQVAEDFGLKVSRKRVARLLHEAGFSFKRGSSVRQHPEDPRPSSDTRPSSEDKPTWTPPT